MSCSRRETLPPVAAARRRLRARTSAPSTPQARITAYDGCIFHVDVGITRQYGAAEPQALVLSANGAVALRADGGETRLVSFEDDLPRAA
jgi:hypothetical protein